MMSTDKASPTSELRLKTINALLLLITSILGFVTFLAILDVILTVGQAVIMRTMSTPLRRARTITTLRNFWMLCGGGLLIAFWFGAGDYHVKRLGSIRTRRILLRTLAVEIAIIAISLII